MSAIPSRRRRVTRFAASASALVVIVVVVCGLIGANALYNSSDGTNAAAPDRPSREFPDVRNFLLGIVDGDGRLASIAVFTERPNGNGGSIVSVPVNAAVRVDGRQVAVGARFEGDEESLEFAVGGLLGLSFDDVTLVRRQTLAKMLAPVGEVAVDLPAAVIDDRVDPAVGETTAVVLVPGRHELAAEGLVDVLTAHATSVPDDVRGSAPVADENDLAVWEAIARRVTARSSGSADGTTGSSIGTVLDSTSVDASSATATTDPPSTMTAATVAAAATSAPAAEPRPRQSGVFQEFVATMFEGPVEARGLASEVVNGSETDDAPPLVRVVRADVLLVFGQISPRQVAAPAASFNVRIVAPFDADAVPGDASAADVAARAIRDLVAAEVNVVSVSTTEGDVPATTTLEVINIDIEDMASRIAGDIVGDHEVETAEYEIPGVDVVITLGEDYLARYESSAASTNGAAPATATTAMIPTTATTGGT